MSAYCSLKYLLKFIFSGHTITVSSHISTPTYITPQYSPLCRVSAEKDTSKKSLQYSLSRVRLMSKGPYRGRQRLPKVAKGPYRGKKGFFLGRKNIVMNIIYFLGPSICCEYNERTHEIEETNTNTKLNGLKIIS